MLYSCYRTKCAHYQNGLFDWCRLPLFCCLSLSYVYHCRVRNQKGIHRLHCADCILDWRMKYCHPLRDALLFHFVLFLILARGYLSVWKCAMASPAYCLFKSSFEIYRRDSERAAITTFFLISAETASTPS